MLQAELYGFDPFVQGMVVQAKFNMTECQRAFWTIFASR